MRWWSVGVDMFLNSGFKMTASFTNVARTKASTGKFIY